MAIPTVNIRFVAGGTDNVQRALRTVEQSTAASSERVIQMKQRQALALQHIEERHIARVKEIQNKELLSEKEKQDKIQHLATRHAQQIKQIQEKNHLSIINAEKNQTQSLINEQNRRNKLISGLISAFSGNIGGSRIGA